MLRLQTEYSRSWQTGLDSNSASFRDGRLLLQFLAVVLSQLRNFRLDHYPAIRLSGILGVIILVIILRFVEVAIRYYLGDDRFLPDFRLVELLDNLTGNLFLFWVVIKYSRAVLGSHIASLAVVCCRVVGREEYLKKILERYDTRVERYLDRFSVSRVPCAHLFIRRIGNVSA